MCRIGTDDSRQPRALHHALTARGRPHPPPRQPPPDHHSSRPRQIQTKRRRDRGARGCQKDDDCLFQAPRHYRSPWSVWPLAGTGGLTLRKCAPQCAQCDQPGSTQRRHSGHVCARAVPHAGQKGNKEPAAAPHFGQARRRGSRKMKYRMIPCVESRVRVVLADLLHHAQPGLLKKILGRGRIPNQPQ